MSENQKPKYLTRPSPPNSVLKPYSHSILSAANMCPMWGVIRYGHRKQYPTSSRAMALEFGAAAHEVFAAIYLYQVGYLQNLPDHMRYHARRIFGDNDRFEKALVTKDTEPDIRDHLISLGYNILHTGDFYNDPFDKYRTVENLELGIIKYVDNVLPSMERNDIWISDKNDPTKPIGVEIPFDIELVREEIEKDSQDRKFKLNSEVMRYVGQIDRLHEPEPNFLRLGENKTGARLDNSWSLSFDMSHQVTGYCLAVQTILNLDCYQVDLHGLKNRPTGHSDDFNPISPKDRDPEMFERFIDWAFYSKGIYDQFLDDWENSPRFTHSCNRYFRPCALLTFCTDTAEGRKEQFEEMVRADLSPSEQAVIDKIGVLE